MGRCLVNVDRLLDDRQLLAGQAEHPRHLFRRGGATQGFGEPQRCPPPLREQFDHVGRDPDCLTGVDQGPLDRLFDPIAGVGAKPGAHRGIEAFDRPEEAEIPLLDEIGQQQATVGIAAGDVDHEPEIGSNHMVAGERVTPTNTLGEPFLVRRSEQGCLVDVPQVGLERVLHGGRPLTTGGRGHDGLGARGTTN